MSKSTAALIVIALIQLAIISLLYVKTDAVEHLVATRSSSEQTAVPPHPTEVALAKHPTDQRIAYVTQDQIRQIIQEELHAELKQLPQSPKHSEPAVASTQYNEAEQQYQRERISQQIDYYTSIGRISDLEMQKLQGDIAQLDDVGRTEMMRQLVKALNSGSVEGRL